MTCKVSIAICTINCHLTIKLLNSLIKLGIEDQIIVVVDGLSYYDSSLSSYSDKYNISMIVNRENMGLSFSRNLAMRIAKYDYIVFFDDDVELYSNIIAKYKIYFINGSDIVGGPLLLPKEYPDIPSWLPEGLSSLLGIHTTQKVIWGGNFGFNLQKAKTNAMDFQIDLGRLGKQLQSGDDTTFVNEYCKINHVDFIFDSELAVYHYINTDKYKVKYLLKRSFWQGRSEVRRRMLSLGIKKEFTRAFIITSTRCKYFILKKIFGALFFFSFLCGVSFELLTKIKNE